MPRDKQSAKESTPKDGNFLSDIKTLRQRVRTHIDEGAVTPNYGADRDKVVNLLNEALATEIVCVLRSHSEYVEGESLRDMIREDLIAERIAIESYREMINYIGDGDSTTRRMLEGILAVEEEHAEDMNSLLMGLAS